MLQIFLYIGPALSRTPLLSNNYVLIVEAASQAFTVLAA